MNDACNEQYYSDVIVYRGGETRDRGGGSCSSPENCTNCADGFYGDSGRCLSNLLFIFNLKSLDVKVNFALLCICRCSSTFRHLLDTAFK